MPRDEFSQSIKEVLARRVGFRCSNPGCRRITTGPQVDPGKASNVGAASHISAAAPDGPRYDATLSSEQRKSHKNGIWLCRFCATMIDNDESRYPTSLLLEWKEASENQARHEIENRDLSQDTHEHREIIRSSLLRFKKEKDNFQYMLSGRPYKSSMHEKAVTEYSFELVTKAVRPLQRVPRFSASATALLSYLEAKDSSNVLKMLEELVPQMEEYDW